MQRINVKVKIVRIRKDGSNPTGVFLINFKHQFFYYFTDQDRQVAYPRPLNSAWKERVLEVAANVFAIPSTRARPALLESTTNFLENSDIGLSDGSISVININGEEHQSPNKRQMINDGASLQAQPFAYWPNSPDANQLFQPRKNVSSRDSGGSLMFCDESLQEAVQRRIKLLQSVFENEDGWRNVIMERDADNYCTKAEILEIRQRATFLCRAYQLALTNMNRWTWHRCCDETCKPVSSLGLNQASFYKAVAIWNQVFRKVKWFPHPNPYVQCGQRPLPRLLEVSSNAKNQIVAFGIIKLAMLTIEKVHDHIICKVILRLTKTWMQEHDDDTTNESTAVPNNKDAARENRVQSFLNS